VLVHGRRSAEAAATVAAHAADAGARSGWLLADLRDPGRSRPA